MGSWVVGSNPATRGITHLALNDVLASGRGSILMLKVYLDRAARKDGYGTVAIAGALFWPFSYDQFLHVWEPFLKEWEASAFHATDFYPGARDFRRKRPDGTPDPERMSWFERDTRRIPGLIEPYVRKLFLVAFSRDEYEAVAPLTWRQKYGPVNFVAAQMMAQSIGHWANDVNHDGEIVYLYENGNGPDDAEMHNGLLHSFRNTKSRKHA